MTEISYHVCPTCHSRIPQLGGRWLPVDQLGTDVVIQSIRDSLRVLQEIERVPPTLATPMICWGCKREFAALVGLGTEMYCADCRPQFYASGDLPADIQVDPNLDFRTLS